MSRNVRMASMGFNFGDEEEEPVQQQQQKKKPSRMSNAGTLSASLLVCSHVLKGAVGEAWIAALATTNKFQGSNKEVFAAYSKFYGLLLSAGYDSWEDYLLEQLLLGRDNSFARAAAQGTLGAGAPILQAVAYDLDVLQEIAVPLEGMAEYIGTMAPTAGPYWVDAASKVSIKQPVKKLNSSSRTPVPALALATNMPSQFIQRPPTVQELGEWKAAIVNKESWSDAVPLLQQYYHLHGFGITSRNTALRWSKGAFEEGAEGSAAHQPTLPALQPQCSALAANLARHCEGQPAHHALLVGPTGGGKSWLLWEATVLAGREKGLRVVDVGSSEFSNILEIARGCARYPRVRFVLVADHLDWPLRGAVANDLLSGLSGSGPSGWPSNTILYAGASASNGVNYDSLTSRFGLIVRTSDLTPEVFGSTVRCIASAAAAKMAAPASAAGAEGGGSSSASEVQISEEDMGAALAWASQHGGLTIRGASTYVKQAMSPAS
ncbi:MAG: hypothetical protein WDW38_001837 [Sanguina aurantia]